MGISWGYPGDIFGILWVISRGYLGDISGHTLDTCWAVPSGHSEITQRASIDTENTHLTAVHWMFLDVLSLYFLLQRWQKTMKEFPCYVSAPLLGN